MQPHKAYNIIEKKGLAALAVLPGYLRALQLELHVKRWCAAPLAASSTLEQIVRSPTGASLSFLIQRWGWRKSWHS